MPRRYTLDFKAAAAKLVTEQGYGNKAAATGLGVPPSTLPHWGRRHGRPPAAAAPRPTTRPPTRPRTTASARRTSGCSWSAKS